MSQPEIKCKAEEEELSRPCLYAGIIHLIQITLLCVVSTPANLLATCLSGLDKQTWLPTCSAAKHTEKGKGSFGPRQSTELSRAGFLLFYPLSTGS